MANYVGTYTNDFGVLHQFVRLSVYAVVDGSRQTTRADTDATYLPAVFIAATGQNERNACDLVQGARIIRHARAWFRADAYLHIPCPWRGGSAEFGQFHQELIANPQIQHTEYCGEHVGAWYSQVFSG